LQQFELYESFKNYSQYSRGPIHAFLKFWKYWEQACTTKRPFGSLDKFNFLPVRVTRLNAMYCVSVRRSLVAARWTVIGQFAISANAIPFAPFTSQRTHCGQPSDSSHIIQRYFSRWSYRARLELEVCQWRIWSIGCAANAMCPVSWWLPKFVQYYILRPKSQSTCIIQYFVPRPFASWCTIFLAIWIDSRHGRSVRFRFTIWAYCRNSTMTGYNSKDAAKSKGVRPDYADTELDQSSWRCRCQASCWRGRPPNYWNGGWRYREEHWQ